MAIIKIKIYYDLICAWCYIGHRTLFQALDLFQKTYPGAKDDQISFIWLPFYRDRNLPLAGVSLQDRLVSAFGEQRTENEVARVQRIGRTHGIDFTLRGTIGHTRDCHRLIHFAGGKGGSALQKGLIEEVCFRWFEGGGGDITSHGFLRECAEAVGMDGDEVAGFLEGREFAEEVDRLDAQARLDGIACVPTFVIDREKIEGAADVETFYETLTNSRGRNGGDAGS